MPSTALSVPALLIVQTAEMAPILLWLDKQNAVILPQVVSDVRRWERLCKAVPSGLRGSTRNNSSNQCFTGTETNRLNNLPCKLNLISFPHVP